MSAADELVDRFQAAWSAAISRRELAASCAPDLHYEDPLTFSAARTVPAALAAHAGRLRTARPDARVERRPARG